MTIHEEVLVFSDGVTVHKSQSKRRMTYNPQGLQRIDKKVNNSDSNKVVKAGGVGKRPSHKESYVQEFTNYPNTVLKFKVERGLHPTQKPVELMEYLIKTYTNENETILDFTMGSGTTGVASKNLNRKFIGIELDEEYFEITREHILKG